MSGFNFKQSLQTYLYPTTNFDALLSHCQRASENGLCQVWVACYMSPDTNGGPESSP
jgi:hypothetical protein